jgi:CRP-like cAMP-binding protein
MDQKVALIGGLPLFSKLNRHDLEALGSRAEEIDVPAGKVLAAQGGYGTEFFVIADGTVSVERDGRVVNQLGPGDHFGELALIADIPRTATVTTTAPSRLIVLGAREFKALRMDHPDIELCLLREVAARLASLEGDRPH